MALPAITPQGALVLAALRSASVLRREPKTLTPDGHEHWWSLTELADQGYLDLRPQQVERLGELSRAARGLCKKHLAASRTQMTVTRFRLTGEGYLAVAEVEAAAGIAGVVSAALDLAQATEDARQAARRELAAFDRLAAEQDKLGTDATAAVRAVLGERSTW
jgi:hypothetical protein